MLGGLRLCPVYRVRLTEEKVFTKHLWSENGYHLYMISPPDQGLGKGWGLLLPGSREGQKRLFLEALVILLLFASASPSVPCLNIAVGMPSPRDSLGPSSPLPSPEPAGQEVPVPAWLGQTLQAGGAGTGGHTVQST